MLNSQHPHTPQTTPFPRPSSSGRHVPRHSISSSQNAPSFRWSPSGQTESTNVPSFIRSPSSKDRSYAASAHPLDQGNRDSQPVLGSNVHLPPSRMRSGSNRETSPELSAIYGRRQSVHEPSPGLAPRAYKQSNLSYSTNSPYTSSPFAKSSTNHIDHGRRPQVHHAEDTESTISTTAPSTIWDDVEDLKHRIKKLELTGRLPSSSGAAISSVFGERPPTASTTMTTISSSPKHNRVNSTSPEASTIKGLETTQLHPLLKTALRRSKAVIDPDLYKALEATVADALTLAAMTGSVAGSDISQSPVSIVGIERQIRRKADGMCRGLTELCIALTEKSQSTLSQSLSPAVNQNRAISLHQSIEGGQEPRFVRASTEEPELRSSSRAMSRLEARRSSMLASNTGLSRRESPRGSTPASSFDVAVNGPDRSSSTRQIQRNANADDEQNTSARPMSRAMVEISRLRPSPSHRTSREYTSQHPLPNPTQRSPSMQSSLPVRRNHFSPPTQSQPSTPNIYSGNRRHLDRTTPPSASDSARIAEMRRQRIASLGQFTTASIGSEKQRMGADDDTPP